MNQHLLNTTIAHDCETPSPNVGNTLYFLSTTLVCGNTSSSKVGNESYTHHFTNTTLDCGTPSSYKVGNVHCFLHTTITCEPPSYYKYHNPSTYDHPNTTHEIGFGSFLNLDQKTTIVD